MKTSVCSLLFTSFVSCFCGIAAGQDADDPFAPDAPKTAESEKGIHVTIRVGEGTDAKKLETVLDAIGRAGVSSVKIEGDAEAGAAVDHPILKKLNKIVIPSIQFIQTPMTDGLDFLRSRAHELDADSAQDRRGINVVVLPPAGNEALTMQLHNIRLGEALAVAGWMTGRQVSVTDSAVVLSPAGKSTMPDATLLPQPDPKVTVQTEAKLKRIMIPSIEFVQTPLQDALDFLRVRGSELDPDNNPAKRGVNIAYREPEPDGQNRGLPADPLITLKLSNISLGDALRFSAETAGMKMDVSGSVVMLSKK